MHQLLLRGGCPPRPARVLPLPIGHVLEPENNTVLVLTGGLVPPHARELCGRVDYDGLGFDGPRRDCERDVVLQVEGENVVGEAVEEVDDAWDLWRVRGVVDIIGV